MKTGAELIADERRRQIKREGYTAEMDDQQTQHQLVEAALCYATHPVERPLDAPPITWPWNLKFWNPSNYVGDLVKAGALIAAEIDRLRREEDAIRRIRHGGMRGCNRPQIPPIPKKLRGKLRRAVVGSRNN